ncbi:MAG: cell division protein ZapA [Alphaproteobacteria bacterium]|nr:cell division protein ZapA [Alphaproteobacteria bacterium]
MGQLTINVNGHHYTIGCGDGEEDRLRSLAEALTGRMDALVGEVGQVGDARLLVMLNLLLLDEIEETRGAMAPEAADDGDDDRAAVVLESLAARIETLAARLEDA